MGRGVRVPHCPLSQFPLHGDWSKGRSWAPVFAEGGRDTSAVLGKLEPVGWSGAKSTLHKEAQGRKQSASDADQRDCGGGTSHCVTNLQGFCRRVKSWEGRLHGQELHLGPDQGVRPVTGCLL